MFSRPDPLGARKRRSCSRIPRVGGRPQPRELVGSDAGAAANVLAAMGTQVRLLRDGRVPDVHSPVASGAGVPGPRGRERGAVCFGRRTARSARRGGAPAPTSKGRGARRYVTMERSGG